jgi:hypothetical protein
VAIPPTAETVLFVNVPFSITLTVMANVEFGPVVTMLPPPFGRVLICIIGCVVISEVLSTKPAAGCCI